MCGRFSLKKKPKELGPILGVISIPGPSDNDSPLPGDPDRPRYNIAPTQDVLAVRADEGNVTATWLRWGLVPPGAKSLKVGARMINARSETVFKQPAFARPVLEQRCVVPADGFIEWKKLGKIRQPYHLRMADGSVFAMAGLWQRWRSPEGQVVQTCTILTTMANEVVAPLHDRMPVILPKAQVERWLNPDLKSADDLRSALVPFPAESMVAVPISRRVNDVGHDDPDCLQEVEPPAPPPSQLGFGFSD